MSKYTFILRKNKIEIELSSTDPAFLTKQMKNWCAQLVLGTQNKYNEKSIDCEANQHPTLVTDFADSAIYESIKESEQVLKELSFTDQQELVQEKITNEIDEIIDNQDIQDTETILPNENDENISNNYSDIVAQSSNLLAEFECDPINENSVQEIEENLGEIISEENPMQQINNDIQSDLIPDDVYTEQPLNQVTETSDTSVEEAIEDMPEPDLSEINDLMAEFDETDAIEVSSESVNMPIDQSDDISLSDFAEEDTTELSSPINNIQAEPSLESVQDSIEKDEAITEDLSIKENSIVEPIKEPSNEEQEISAIQEPVIEEEPLEIDASDEDLDSVLSDMLSEMEATEEPSEEPSIEDQSQEEISNQDDLLDSFFEEPVTEDIQQASTVEEQPKFVPYESYITTVPLKVPIDLLLATANYICKFEGKTKFTTKDISAKTMETYKRPVSPNTVLAAVNKGFIEVIPDFTGTAESNEYILTDAGYNYISNNLPYEQE